MEGRGKSRKGCKEKEGKQIHAVNMGHIFKIYLLTLSLVKSINMRAYYTQYPSTVACVCLCCPLLKSRQPNDPWPPVS